jgi:hypothetical protein
MENEEPEYEEITEDLFASYDPVEFLNNLPKLKKKKNEFLIKLDWENDETIYVAVRELYWHEMLEAETQAFRIKSEEEMYLAGEHERREILKKAIKWIAVIPSCEFLENENGQILSYLNFDVVENVWSQYQTYVFVGATEAASLYNAAVRYYNGDSQTNSPVPPTILEIDVMLKFGGMTRKELKKITATEMEKMQIVFMARAEALGLGVKRQVQNVHIESPNDSEIDQSVYNTMPPSAKEAMGQFLTPGR